MEEQTITIKVEKVKTKTGNEFMTYKMNDNGNAVDLRFRKDSANISDLKPGIHKIVITGLNPDRNSFYPRFWATYVKKA